MHVRMVGHGRAPAVQYGGDTDPRAEALGIACDREGGLGRRLHQQVIDDALVLVGDGTQLARQRVDDVKIRHRQELRFAVGEPSARGCALTLWAMPVAARVVRDLGMAARRVLAARDMPAERRRATALDRTHYLQLLEAHMAEVGLSPRRAVIAEDVRDLQSKSNHGRRRYGAGGSPLAPVAPLRPGAAGPPRGALVFGNN